MSGKDAEIERAFERAEKDAEIGHDATTVVAGAVFDYPIPIWKSPEPCPDCKSVAACKMKHSGEWAGLCLDCGHLWTLETDNERENDV